MPSATANVTWNCEIVSKEILDWVEVCMLRRNISKQNCQQIPGYYGWIEDSKLSADTRILWMDRGSKLNGNCLVIEKVSEPCDKIRVRNKRKKIEEVCQNTTETMTMEEWKTIWGPSLLETYSYLGKVNWCIMWEGKKNQDFGQKSLFKEQYRKKVEMMELWNCTQVLTCDTPPVQIGLEPVRVLLQWGCECRGHNHTLAKKEKEPWDCKTTTVRSPGILVWVMGHGLWTTHMPIDGAVTQITLGVPTLCPFWKTSKLQEKELGYKNSPTIFGEQLAKDLESWEPPPGEGQLLQYVDDLLRATRTQETCVDWTVSLLNFLGLQGYRVSQKKAQIVRQTVIYLGYEVSAGQRTLGQDCKEAIYQTLKPQTVKELRTFLGMTGWYRLWIYNYGLLVKSLYHLIMEGSRDLQWTKEATQAFDQLKKALMSAPALGLPDVNNPFFLFSHKEQGIALGILAQNLGPYQRAVAYLSKQLDTAAKGWPRCLRAVAAVAINIQEACKFTLGQKMTVLVSHTMSGVLEAKGGHSETTEVSEQDDVEIVVANIVNPSSFLSGSTGEPVIHECLETTEVTYSSRQDLKDTPLEDAETCLLTEAGMSSVEEGMLGTQLPQARR
ncbi:hypothetical protein DUI87_12274 [Hirundo rustica rustica]|uniref:ribonuclease H n=1 Tax=Hirundo rustica rustica TaxID=333673 RepID=A0A3M0KD35_HIRRU|nr:hypothetical protein DUI87_12274 [Hirundo rustica rustica]